MITILFFFFSSFNVVDSQINDSKCFVWMKMISLFIFKSVCTFEICHTPPYFLNYCIYLKEYITISFVCLMKYYTTWVEKSQWPWIFSRLFHIMAMFWFHLLCLPPKEGAHQGIKLRKKPPSLQWKTMLTYIPCFFGKRKQTVCYLF